MQYIRYLSKLKKIIKGEIIMKNNLVKVNFKEQRDEFNQKWIHLLTSGGELDKLIEFDEILTDAPCEILAIMKYRRVLRERGEYITAEHLKVANRMPEEYLKQVLEQLFLEPVLDWHIEYFFKEASKKYRDMNDAMEVLYRKHMEDPGRRFLTVASII